MIFDCASLLDGQDIVPEATEIHYNWQWKVLISKEPCHKLRGLVLADLLFYLFAI